MTEIVKVLKEIRFDNQELLKDMATRLKVSSAFLSAVETGKKKAPSDFVQRISKEYQLSQKKEIALREAVDMSAKEIKLNLKTTTLEQHKAAVSFAKVLNELTDDDISKIMKVFAKSSKRKGK